MNHFCIFSLCVSVFQLLASDGVQESIPVSVTVTVLDANDNTPTFANVSYNVNLFTNMAPGETVLQVHTVKHNGTFFETRGISTQSTNCVYGF